MFIKILKWSGLALLIMAMLFGSGFLLIAHNINVRAAKTYAFPKEKLSIPTDSATIARGKHLVAIKGCEDCHGTDLSGKIMINDAAIGTLAASNLTKGKGGLPSSYSNDNWLTALRHGINENGKPLIFMPSHETSLLSANDLAAIISYCSIIKPVDRLLPATKLGPMAKVLGYFDKMPLLSVEKIDHNRSMIMTADTSEGIELGKYLAISCSGCHQKDFKGGDAVVPGGPKVPSLTAAGNVGKWSQEQFINTLRTGKTPSGHQLKNEDMPWKMTAQYHDKELASLYQYFQTI